MAAKGRASALITIRNALLNGYPKRIADLALKSRLPSMSEGREHAGGGARPYRARRPVGPPLLVH